jgi:hypothetical protein
MENREWEHQDPQKANQTNLKSHIGKMTYNSIRMLIELMQIFDY